MKITVGLLYTYIGLVLFMTGVNVGFLPAGSYLGRQIAALEQSWVLIPIGMLMGWFIVQAEPAVHVLNRQVEELTSGAIPGKAMSTSLSIGVAVSIGLAMLRVLTGISILSCWCRDTCAPSACPLWCRRSSLPSPSTPAAWPLVP